jgi:hemolysin activation/secretion protein
MFKTSVLGLALVLAAQVAAAQIGAGGQIQQIPAAPGAAKSIPELRVQRGHAAVTAPGGERVVVTSLHVRGQRHFTEAALIDAAHFRAGATMDLNDLRAMARRITDFYARHGYFVAQAYVPAQDIVSGVVTLTVVEGRYGHIAVRNRAHVSGRLVRGILAGVDVGDPIVSPPLQRRLLLLSDMPGVAVSSTLKPGAAVGDSDLLVDLEPGHRFSGSLQADNGGNRYTGEYRGGATINLNNPTGHGDVASLRFLTSGDGLNYIRGSYEARIQDATVGVAFTHLGYRLGREFSDLGASGTADIASVYGSYPLIRSRDNNLYATAGFDYRMFHDHVRSTGSTIDRADPVGLVGLNGDFRDGLFGGGSTTYAVGAAFGDLDIQSAQARAADALTARTEGGYAKVYAAGSRLQQVAGPLSLWVQARGQLASKNLDLSEKMELGGPDGVRAYPEGEAYGDEGYLLNAEARLALPTWRGRVPGRFQAIAFVDNGSVRLVKNVYAEGPNVRTLSAAGVGLNWANDHGWAAQVAYAFKVGDERATSAPDRSGRLWVQVTKVF